ncbi:hypothetical protein ABFS82_06G003200 [Erythranthe guttata]|uniref:double-stranded RNA-binding protein 3 n=1 Tax=Erythranthe guttata TaxID=4155 RepID=UPI00064D8B86|nr:PREDICTED: double-stranded RNA-binding protein 3 [Erythranthe guttata]|eukprot:XP_012844034.1 PREDICTED: double-stranded RNA-binding protein 3 [Erythranthe guttata]
MYKNQLQELAQRSCFNLPSYACIREGPDHAPRFKASVNFNGEIFESPTYSTTLRQAEHSAAEAALNSLSSRGPSRSLTARVLDETGVYKNLLQETSHRAGLKLPLYTTVRSGPGHVPVFTSTVDLAGMTFTGESAKTKKQAEKNAAITAWSALKAMPNLGPLCEASKEMVVCEDEDHNGTGRRRRRRMIGEREEEEEEELSIRRRDQQPIRGRMQRRHCRDNNNNQRHESKLVDPFSETSVSHKNKISFISLLPPPPPPPRIISKILPPNLESPPPPLHQSNTSQIMAHQVEEAGQRGDDDQEWVNMISEAIKKKPIIQLVNSSSSSQITGRRSIFNGGVYHPQRMMAPAVQIRSVIPVCAAPPVASPSPSIKEASPSPSAELASALSNLKL